MFSPSDDVWFIDTETHLIEDGRQAPSIVSLQSCRGRHFTSSDVEIDTKPYISDKFLSILRTGQKVAIFNAAFDITVLMAHDSRLVVPIFEALDKGQIICLMLAERLAANREGTLNIMPRLRLEHETVGPFSLAACVKRRLDIDISETKSDSSWRLRYRELDGLSLREWPRDAVKYACDDVYLMKEVAYSFINSFSYDQETTEDFITHTGMYDLTARTRAAVALRLMECWGLITDPVEVQRLEAAATSMIDSASSVMLSEALMRDDGTLDLEALRAKVEDIFGSDAPKTDKGAIKTDRQTLAESGDPILQQWAQAGFARKILNTFVPIVKLGTSCPVHARYQPLVETGRTSCSNPPLQQIPRSVGELGVRECFIPRDGNVFLAADYDAIEMRTFAQVLLDRVGHSRLADGFKRDPDFDPHTYLAQRMTSNWDSMSAKDRKGLRQKAKLANFGYAGGLGISTFLRYAAGFGLDLTISDAQFLKNSWFMAYPEVKTYFKQISHGLNLNGGRMDVFHARSARYRGNCTFTQCANTPFQGMTADGALNALYIACREMYSEPRSPLFGCRPSIFIHDEIIIECPRDRINSAGKRLCAVMIEGMKKYVPDIPVTASPVAMNRWSKDADTVYDERSGELLVWQPKS